MQTRMSLGYGTRLPTHGNVSTISSVPGRKNSAKQEVPNWASQAKANKNQSQHPEDSSFQYLGSAGCKCTSLLCTLGIFPVSIQRPHKTARCKQVALEGFVCSELYGISIIVDVASDSTWFVQIEHNREDLICHVTALDQHCKATLYTEERVPWLEA